MPFFDYYMMVDWSGGNERKCNRSDSIWIAFGRNGAAEPLCQSPASRSEAVQFIADQVTEILRTDPRSRILACFDFAFGFPRNFAKHLPVPNGIDQPWRRLWSYLAAGINDDVATRPGCQPSNRSNRFDVANQL